MGVIRKISLLVIGLSALLAHLACASTPTTSSAPENFQVGQIIDVNTGKLVEFEELQSEVTNADVIYIGEEHYTPSHIEAAVRI